MIHTLPDKKNHAGLTRTAWTKRAIPRALALPALALIAILLSGCNSHAGSTVIVAGSTSVQPYAEVLAEEFAHHSPEYEVDVQGGGSSAGITAARSGTADIGMSSRHLNEKEEDLWSVEIAKDGLSVIIHPGNPIENLTLDQIRDIYAGVITDWQSLGGNAAKIHLISREEGSGTRSAFEELVMSKIPITPRAIIQDSNGAVRQLVSDDRNSIGFISLGLVDLSVKAITLDGVEGTMDNVLNGSYSLHRPFLYVSAGEPAGPAKAFVDYTLSDEGQLLLMHEGLIPRTEGVEQ